MKTLKNYTMVYDADCPLCSAYTRSFVTTGMLDEEGRIPYQQVGGSFCPGMDEERSKNEIALVNRENGTIHYGLDSLLTVLENRFRWMRIARIQPLKFCLQKLYNFISYNRKVIMPHDPSNVRRKLLATPGGECGSTTRFDCTPTFKLKYRIAYIVVAWLLTSIALVEYSKLIGGFIPATNFFREFLICGGQVFFQAISVSFVTQTRRWDYLGNMMTVSLFGALLLLPAFGLNALLPTQSPMIFLAYFMLVVGLMLYEHARRMKILELGWWPSVSWVLYRVIALGLILIPSALKS